MHVMSQLTYFTIWHDSNVVADITWLAYKMIQIMAKNQCLKSTSFFKSRFSSKYFFPLNIIISHKQVSVQFSGSVVSNSLWPHELQHARAPCPSPTPGVHPNPCSLSQWCHPTISSSVVPFSSGPQSFPASGFFKWASSSHQVAKILEFQLQHQSFQWTPRTDLLWNGLVGSPCSPRDSQESSPTPQFKGINSSVLSFLYSLTLTSIHDHWKNHSLD